MFNKSSAARLTREAQIEITVNGCKPAQATLFLKPEQRVSDVLNDERGFLPVRFASGRTMVVAKTSIISIVEREAEAAKKRPQNQSPYDVLRIKETASVEEIKRAFKQRMKSVHPDSLVSLDIDDEIKEAAIAAAQRVNAAYQTIMAARSVNA
ncbi:MAG: J domain-containing protein [Pseudomonadota bacterium]